MHAPFDRVETWIFDLDNTLYPPHELLFGQIETRMSAFMVRELGISHDEAQRLRKAYWHDHGTTLAGLMLNHRLDPDPFLREVHDIDFTPLTPDPALRAALLALPHRRIVYTNGARDYAGHVLDALGLDGVFERVWSIEDAFYEPKPRESAFRRIFGKDGLDPRRAAFFEDDHRNLKVPKGMGVVTALVKPAGAPLGSAPMGDRPAPFRSSADAPTVVPDDEAPALAAEAEAAAEAAPIRPPQEDTPPHVDYVVRDLPGFLAGLTDPQAGPPA